MFADVLFRIAELERKVSGMMVQGTVEERDLQKGVRVKIADGEEGPVLTSWIRPSDHNTGVRTAILPRKGAQLMVFTPPGSEAAAGFIPIGHHENSQNPAAAADDSVLYEDGSCRISVDGGKVLIKSGGSSITVSDGKIELSSDLVKALGAQLFHNNKSVGDTHEHTEVERGADLTGPPA